MEQAISSDSILFRLTNMFRGQKDDGYIAETKPQEENELWDMDARDALRVSILAGRSSKTPATDHSPGQKNNVVGFNSSRNSVVVSKHGREPLLADQVSTSLKRQKKPSTQIKSKPASVLIIDPDKKMHMVHKSLMRRFGVSSHCVLNGRSALDWLSQHCPRIVLVDTDVSGNVSELISDIRNLPMTRNLQIMMMSEDDSRPHSASEADLKTVRHFLKPCNVHALYGALNKHIKLVPKPIHSVFKGSLGLVMDNHAERLELRRILVKEGYAVDFSCSPAEFSKRINYQRELSVSGWILQIQDEDVCIDIMEQLDDRFNVPVLVGLEEMPRICSKAALSWRKRLLEKMQSLVESK